MACVSAPEIWGMRPDCSDIIWSIKIMDLGLVSEEFLIDPPKFLPLVLHDLLWDFPNSQATKEGSFLKIMNLLGVITLLGNLRG